MHVDRFGARKAREMAIDAVKQGAGECLVRAVYAPNVAEPLDVQMEIVGGGDVRIDRSTARAHGTRGVAVHRTPEAKVALEWMGDS